MEQQTVQEEMVTNKQWNNWIVHLCRDLAISLPDRTTLTKKAAIKLIDELRETLRRAKAMRTTKNSTNLVEDDTVHREYNQTELDNKEKGYCWGMALKAMWDSRDRHGQSATDNSASQELEQRFRFACSERLKVLR